MTRDGFCECGCGGLAPIAKRTRSYLGHVVGEPVRFIHNHHLNVNPPHKREQEYEVRDCGYKTPCWVWLYAPSSQGYGKLTVRGVRDYAHRIFYKRASGEIPVGLELDHLCRNRMCVNPDHLEPVTRAENIRRGAGTNLTVDQVREIRQSSERPADIARRLGLTASHVINIRARRLWRDVP